jgi:hypothetical protein
MDGEADAATTEVAIKPYLAVVALPAYNLFRYLRFICSSLNA